MEIGMLKILSVHESIDIKIEEPYFTNLNFTVLMQELYFRNWWLAIINPSERRLYIDERPYMEVRLGWAD